MSKFISEYGSYKELISELNYKINNVYKEHVVRTNYISIEYIEKINRTLSFNANIEFYTGILQCSAPSSSILEKLLDYKEQIINSSL